MTARKPYTRRPVVMDGERRFKTCMDAARYLVKTTGVAVRAESVQSNITEVLRKGRGTVYGHTFADDDWPRTPAEYEKAIADYRAAIIAMWRLVDIWCLKGVPPRREDVDKVAERLRDNGIEVS